MLETYNLHSRIHVLHSLTNDSVKCFIKRDDELSFSISGSKIRKYSSLIPHLRQQKIRQAILIGGAFSNNVLGLSQLLIENNIKPILFLRKAGSELIQGNRLFIEMLVDKNHIHWISRSEWPEVESIAHEYMRKSDTPSFIIPEGAFIKESVPGAMTLASDISKNEVNREIRFDHIFIDAGTGLQAIALILGMYEVSHPAQIHVVLLSGEPTDFVNKLDSFSNGLYQAGSLRNFQVYSPTIAASFGSVNVEIFEYIRSFARLEGVFLDPIYSAKMFMTGKTVIQKNNLKGNILFIHSGGAFSLSGFQERLKARH